MLWKMSILDGIIASATSVGQVSQPLDLVPGRYFVRAWVLLISSSHANTSTSDSLPR